VDIARPVLAPQDVARLREMGQQGVVAGVLPMMRVEAAKGPGHASAGAHHCAVDIDRQPRQLQPGDGVGDEVVVELDQRGQGGLGELPEPVADGARRRDPRQATEAGDQRIAGEIAEMLQPAGPDVEQGQHEQGQTPAAVVATGGSARRAQSARQLALPQVAAQQLQAAVRGQLLGSEFDMQGPLDHPAQARYAQSHQRGLLCVGSNVGAFSLSIAQEAFLLPVTDATHHLFSDWG
jgi:hypothetical protein